MESMKMKTHCYGILNIKHANIIYQHVTVFSDAPNCYSDQAFLDKNILKDINNMKMLILKILWIVNWALILLKKTLIT